MWPYIALKYAWNISRQRERESERARVVHGRMNPEQCES